MNIPNINFICLASITSSPESVQYFMSWVPALQNRVSYVVCKNEKDGTVFPDYDGMGEAMEFREEFIKINNRITKGGVSGTPPYS